MADDDHIITRTTLKDARRDQNSFGNKPEGPPAGSAGNPGSRVRCSRAFTLR